MQLNTSTYRRTLLFEWSRNVSKKKIAMPVRCLTASPQKTGRMISSLSAQSLRLADVKTSKLWFLNTYRSDQKRQKLTLNMKFVSTTGTRSDMTHSISNSQKMLELGTRKRPRQMILRSRLIRIILKMWPLAASLLNLTRWKKRVRLMLTQRPKCLISNRRKNLRSDFKSLLRWKKSHFPLSRLLAKTR